MPTAQTSGVSADMISYVEDQSQVLRRDFEQSFEFWFRDEQWRPCVPDFSDAPCDAPVALLNDALEARASRVTNAEEGQLLLALCLDGPQMGDGESFPVVAVTNLGSMPRSAAERIARLYDELLAERFKAAIADCAVNSMAEQVTSNFEELMLLRSMAEHLQLSGGPDDPTDIASKLLPALQNTLKCEHLALVQHREDGERDRVYWAGEAVLSDDACFELIHAVAGDGERPRIMNEFQLGEAASAFPEVREVAVVPIGGNGWLVASNRIAEPVAPTNPFGEIDQCDKFGTFEVTLMTSAASMLTTHFNNMDLLQEKQVIFTETVKSLINAVDARDPYTRGHSERVGLFSKRFAHHLGLGKHACERIYLSGLLHDIGKIGVSDATLQKPGKLTDDEYDELKQHPDQGWAILSNLHTMQDIIPGVLYHHERFDGKGYPCGLAGDEIPIEGRLMSICDAYDAMTSDRPYRKGMPQEKAEAILIDGKGTQWDPELVDAFLELMPDIIRIRQTYSPRPVKKRSDVE